MVESEESWLFGQRQVCSATEVGLLAYGTALGLHDEILDQEADGNELQRTL